MMGKASNRKKAAQPGAGPDVHQQIAAEAAAVRAKDQLAFQPAHKTPALKALLDSASEALGGAVPATFVHEGRTYYLRVSIGLARLMVFETATAAEPMAFALSGSHEEYGHIPYH